MMPRRRPRPAAAPWLLLLVILADSWWESVPNLPYRLRRWAMGGKLLRDARGIGERRRTRAGPARFASSAGERPRPPPGGCSQVIFEGLDNSVFETHNFTRQLPSVNHAAIHPSPQPLTPIPPGLTPSTCCRTDGRTPTRKPVLSNRKPVQA